MDASSRRTIWLSRSAFRPRAHCRGVCELREGFRHFRTDRIGKVQILVQRYPRRRQALLKDWRETEGIPDARVSVLIDQTETLDSCFDAFSSREPVPTSLENATPDFTADSFCRVVP